jgi:methyl-accepting chemotaxis protein
MSNLKVAHKLLLAFAMLVAGVIAAGALVASSMTSIQKITTLNARSYAYVDAIGDTTGPWSRSRTPCAAMSPAWTPPS